MGRRRGKGGLGGFFGKLFKAVGPIIKAGLPAALPIFAGPLGALVAPLAGAALGTIFDDEGSPQVHIPPPTKRFVQEKQLDVGVEDMVDVEELLEEEEEE